MQSEKYLWRLREPQPFHGDSRADGIDSKFPDDPVYLRFEFPRLIPEPFRSDGNPWRFLQEAFKNSAFEA